MPRRAYPTDLTDAQWAILEPLVPPPQPGGRPPAHARRELINAMLYVLRGGVRGAPAPRPAALADRVSLLPAVADGRHLGAGQRRTARAGAAAGGARPHAECGDPRQPEREDDGKGGPRGYDGGKKLTGRKRHILVDTEGLLLRVVVHAADMRTATAGRWC